MRKYAVVIIVFLVGQIFLSQAKGQNTTQNYEVGVRTSNLNNLSLIYKKQKTDNTWSRLRIAKGEFDIGRVSPFRGSISLGVAGGQENRKNLADKLFFVTGYELSCFLNTSVVGDKLSLDITPGIGAVLGFSYMASDNFIVGVETIPIASFKFGYSNKDILISDFNIRFDSSYGAIFIAYRFSK